MPEQLCNETRTTRTRHKRILHCTDAARLQFAMENNTSPTHRANQGGWAGRSLRLQWNCTTRQCCTGITRAWPDAD
eukprot:6092080-Lingulodinium_polyedra.AAC.1